MKVEARLSIFHADCFLLSGQKVWVIHIKVAEQHKLWFAGYHSLYEWYRSVESEQFPDPTGLRSRIEKWTFGMYRACIKYLMFAFEIPEVRII